MAEIHAPEEQLAAAVDGRPRWTRDGQVAVSAPPGADAQVRVRPIVNAARARESWVAIIVTSAGQVERTRPCFNPVEAVRWAESLPL